MIAHSENSACCIFATKSGRKHEEVLHTRSLDRTKQYLRLRDVHHQMWRTTVYARLEQTQTLGREHSKSQSAR